MRFSKNIQSRSACYTLTTVALLAVTGIILALKYARDSNLAERKAKRDSDTQLADDIHETESRRAALLNEKAEGIHPVRHIIKSHFPKTKTLPPQNYDPQF